MSATWTYLLLAVFLGWGPGAGPWGGKAQQPGAPLSEQEYQQFFRLLRVARRASTACLFRQLYGCHHPLVQRLDEYENHGFIPEGPICSSLPPVPFFINFCTFSLYRCTRKKYFIKRIACPEESTAKLESTQAFNDMTMSSDSMLSSIFSSHPLFLSSINPEPRHSSSDTEAAEMPTSFHEGTIQLRNMQLYPPAPHALGSDQLQEGLPSNDIEDLLLRLQDTHVQSLLETLRQMLTLRKTVPEAALQAAALRLLVALNNANVLVGNHH